MVALLGSAWAFLSGVLRRFYWWLPAIILDPFDYNERYIEPALGRNVDLPAFAFPLAFGLGITLAAVLTFHEQRTKTLANVVFEIRQASIALTATTMTGRNSLLIRLRSFWKAGSTTGPLREPQSTAYRLTCRKDIGSSSGRMLARYGCSGCETSLGQQSILTTTGWL